MPIEDSWQLAVGSNSRGYSFKKQYVDALVNQLQTANCKLLNHKAIFLRKTLQMGIFLHSLF